MCTRYIDDPLMSKTKLQQIRQRMYPKWLKLRETLSAKAAVCTTWICQRTCQGAQQHTVHWQYKKKLNSQQRDSSLISFLILIPSSQHDASMEWSRVSHAMQVWSEHELAALHVQCRMYTTSTLHPASRRFVCSQRIQTQHGGQILWEVHTQPHAF